MTAKINTLFISFYFPPFSRVGGRRWAKHIKYLERFGEQFEVLAGNFKQESPWMKDVDSYEQKVTRIPVKIYYPYFKQVLPKSFFGKIIWKWSYKKSLRLQKKHKGNFWDDSRSYESLFLEKAKEIIKKNKINHVCLTVGPFSYSTILPQLKKEFKDLKVTIDFRDYWEDGFDGLNGEAIKEEEKKLEQVLANVDLVLAPNNEMCNHFSLKYSKKTYCLPHSIDEDYQSVAANKIVNTTNKIHIIYGGTLYEKLDKYIVELIDLIKAIKKEGYEVELTIHTVQPNYKDLLNEHHITHRILPQLPTNDYIKATLTSDIVLLFRPDWSPNGFSTKFFETIALRKPMLYLGPKGEVNKFIKEHLLGFALNDSSYNYLAKEIIENLKSHKIPDLNYPLQALTFHYQTKALIDFWNKFYNFES